MNGRQMMIALWPLMVLALASFFHKKQNSKKAWTGGPISWPKSIWLSYTTTTWFFLPLIFLTLPDLIPAAKIFFIFHLISWWIRGPLELVMIYRWFNWTPRYGISHDLFHLVACLGILIINREQFYLAAQGSSTALLSLLFAIVIVIGTLAEITFAALFLKFRSRHEADENVYFASDDPKWIFINRLTAVVVTFVLLHLALQSALLIIQ